MYIYYILYTSRTWGLAIRVFCAGKGAYVVAWEGLVEEHGGALREYGGSTEGVWGEQEGARGSKRQH